MEKNMTVNMVGPPTYVMHINTVDIRNYEKYRKSYVFVKINVSSQHDIKFLPKFIHNI